jgi:hypothetical protein
MFQSLTLDSLLAMGFIIPNKGPAAPLDPEACAKASQYIRDMEAARGILLKAEQGTARKKAIKDYVGYDDGILYSVQEANANWKSRRALNPSTNQGSLSYQGILQAMHLNPCAANYAALLSRMTELGVA